MSPMTGLMTGAVGYFWTDVDDFDMLERAMPGHVQLSDDGDLTIELLAPHESTFREPPLPTSVAARTSKGGALFLDVRHGRLTPTSGDIESQHTPFEHMGSLLADPPKKGAHP